MPEIIDDSNNPSFETAAYKEMVPKWELIRTVAGGTAAMRAAGSTYLPPEEGESQKAYDRRLKRTVLFNAYRRTRDGLVGMVFCENPEIGEDTPDLIKEQLENVDLVGTHIDVFAKEVFTDQFEGHVVILVDMQPALPEGATKADEMSAARRPYFVKYKGSQVPNWRCATVNGREVITQITFKEYSCEPVGMFGESMVTKYRVFSINAAGTVDCEVWREMVDDSGKKTYVSEGIVNTSLTEIPIAIAYGRKHGTLCSSPTLYDLAELNIAHWQEYSDYRNILHVANVPILVRKGGDPSLGLEIGPGSFVDIPGGDANLFYCEHQGSAIGAAKAELDDIEQRMAALGLSMVAPKNTTQVTATEKRLDNAESKSELATMARSLQDALERCMGYMGTYQGIEGGSIEIAVDDDDLTYDAQTLTVLLNAVDAGKLSLEAWLTMLKQGDILPEEMTVAEELARIRSVDVIPPVIPGGAATGGL